MIVLFIIFVLLSQIGKYSDLLDQNVSALTGPRSQSASVCILFSLGHILLPYDYGQARKNTPETILFWLLGMGLKEKPRFPDILNFYK